MPPKRAVEALKSAEECILQHGKHGNVIKWREHMQTIVTELYGIVGMFFTTGVRYELPKLSYEDYPSDSSSESSDESDEEVPVVNGPVDQERTAAAAAAKAARAAARLAKSERQRKAAQKSRAKFRENEYIQRKKDLKTQHENERTVFPMMWKRMSLISQSRVREEEEYRTAYLTLDCVLLWTLIERTHLTHMYGADEALVEYNQHQQEMKYASMRQGEREHLVTFKNRFDEQVTANLAVGIAAVSESKRALDFLGKLDPRRFGVMMGDMKHDALRRKPDAFPNTLASAFHVSNQWNEGRDPIPAAAPAPAGANAAYVTEGAHVTASNDPEKKAGKAGGTGKKSLADVECFKCELKGHYARNCPQRKPSVEKVHVTTTESDSEYEGEVSEWGIALVAAQEVCCFTKYDVLLDNEASLNIFSNKDLLTDVRVTDKKVRVTGIEQRGGVSVDQEGNFGEFGTVYYSGAASANILSFASQVDSGAAIRYDYLGDCFTLRPKGSESVYRFGRKHVAGSEGRFYSCDWREFMNDRALVATVTENLRAFTKREVEQARKAREMLARMGFPTVEQAMSIINSGSNFEVSARDFQIAEAIWGKDIASLKGKTTKRATAVADITVSTKILQRDQVLSIDIMYLDKLAILVGVATPLGLTIAYSLNTADLKKPARTAAQVKLGISHFIGVLASQNFRASVIMSDGESAVVSLVDELGKLGVEVDISGAGGHVARIERKIRLVKERVRSHVAYHLPFTLSTVGIAMCVLYCISRLNYEPAGLREWGPSPREAFIGRKPDGKRDFRCSFGDYAQCTVTNTDSGMESRTEDCVVMLPLGNRTGSVRMLSLKSGRLVNRDQFRILPMPESVIKRLNDLALADGRVKGKGELYTKPATYAQDAGAVSDLPDTIEPEVNDGVDPAVLPLDNVDEPDQMDNGEGVQHGHGGEYEQSDGDAVNDMDARRAAWSCGAWGA